eukprot:SAG11_NODE_724_length_7524_cov_6.241481_5_plen_42_part_00
MIGTPFAFVAVVFWIFLLKICVKPLVYITILCVSPCDSSMF